MYEIIPRFWSRNSVYETVTSMASKAYTATEQLMMVPPLMTKLEAFQTNTPRLPTSWMMSLWLMTVV